MVKNFLITIIFITCVFGNVLAQSVEDYISWGLKNSPLLYDYNNQKLAGKIDSLLLLATFKPQVNQLTQAIHYPSGTGWGYDEAITNGGTYSSLVSVTQPLFTKKRISGQLQTIELLNQALKLNTKITILDLKKSITAQYLTAYTDFTQNQFNQSVPELLTRAQNTVKALVGKGVYLVTDYMNLQILIRAQSIAVSLSLIQLKNDLALLNLLCGISEKQQIKLVKPELTVQNNFGPENSPVFAQFRIDSLKNRNSRQIIDLNYRPKVNIFADGTVKEKQEPLLLLFEIQMFPPFISTNSLHSFKPNPEPFSFIRPSDVDWTSELNMLRFCFSSMPIPESMTEIT